MIERPRSAPIYAGEQLLLRLGKSLEMIVLCCYILLVGCIFAVETFDLINSSSQCKSLLARTENLSIQSESEFLGY